jgi:hypothetical protein
LEYWFFKVNAGPVALLVDWIARRRLNEDWLRASIHSPVKREVLFEKLPASMPGDNFLTPHHTTGHLGDIAWDLEISPGGDWITPDIFPFAALRMGDCTLNSMPSASFTGWIRHGEQQFELKGERGMLSNYWGRRLMHDWWWLSVQQFDQPGIALECMTVHSGIWGTSLRLPFGYVLLRQDDRKEYYVLPMGLIEPRGNPEDFQIKIPRVGKAPLLLKGAGRDYRELGDGIINTLFGDLEIWEGSRMIACAKGTAGIERRAGA